MKKIGLIFVFFLFSLVTGAQDSTTVITEFKSGVEYVIKTQSDFVYQGYVISETKNEIVVENKISLERTTLKKNDIYSYRPLKTNHSYPNDAEAEENLHAANYMLSSGAFLFEENTGSSTGHWLLVENIDYAFNENWAVNLTTLAFYPFGLGVKCAYPVGREEYVGASVFAMGDLFSDNGSSPFFGYGACARFTKGNSNNNFTFSGGVVGINSLFSSPGNISFLNMSFISGAYCTRLRSNIALNLEGWYFPGSGSGLGGAGVKFIGNDYLCWTVGVFSLINGNDNVLQVNYKAIPIPYFSLSRKFR